MIDTISSDRRHGEVGASCARPGRLLLVVSAVALALSACGAGQVPAVTGGQATEAMPSATGGPSATQAPESPTLTLDPAWLGLPGRAPEIVQNATETVDGVITEDITFSRADVVPTDAYLVRPAHPRRARLPAIVWFHWLESGSPTSNRTEFLEEAQALAKLGLVSVLVQGVFPWTDRPSSLEHDLPAVAADARMLRAALDLVAARGDVEAGRIALVGHDFGAMYASVVFGLDDRAAALVMLAPTARWADWFLRYWPHADSPDAYQAAMDPLDPLAWLRAAAGRPILLQFASQDQYVPADVAAEISAAAGESAETLAYDSGHELNEAARAERDAWLAEILQFD